MEFFFVHKKDEEEVLTVTTMMTFFHELDIIEAANVVVEVGISLRKLQQIQMNSNLHQMPITLSKYASI